RLSSGIRPVPGVSRVGGETFAVSWLSSWVVSEPFLPRPAASWVTALFLGHQATGTRAATNRTAAAIDRYQPRPGPHDVVSFATEHPTALGLPHVPQNDWAGEGGETGPRSAADAPGCKRAAGIGEGAARTSAAMGHAIARRPRTGCRCTVGGTGRCPGRTTTVCTGRRKG